MTTDASDYAMGAVLSQVWDDGEHPVAFESRKMNPAEQNYPTHEKELLAVIHALRTWRHYLLGRKFTIVSDHHSLKFLQTQPQLSRRQARWLELLAEFDYEIVHRPGKSNVVADALSRLNNIAVQNLGTVKKGVKREDLFKGLEQSYKKDKETKRLLENQDAEKDFCIVQNKIFYTGKGRMQLYPPQGDYRDFIMNECHDSRYAGHLGMKKTEELVQRDFYWPTLHQDVTS